MPDRGGFKMEKKKLSIGDQCTLSEDMIYTLPSGIQKEYAAGTKVIVDKFGYIIFPDGYLAKLGGRYELDCTFRNYIGIYRYIADRFKDYFDHDQDIVKKEDLVAMLNDINLNRLI